MLKVDLPACLGILNILPLAGLLLHQLIRHKEANDIVRHAHTQTVARRKIPFVGNRVTLGISPVRVIRQHRRVEISLRVKPIAAGRKPVRSLRVRNSRRAVYRGETSAARVKPPVPSCWNVFLRGDFNNAAQFPPEFGGKTCRQHAQRLDFVCLKGRCKRRGPILRQWQTVHDKLHVVLRAARMKHAVCLIDPTRLLRYKVQQFAPRLCSIVLLDRLPPDRVKRSRGIRIHQCR